MKFQPRQVTLHAISRHTFRNSLYLGVVSLIACTSAGPNDNNSNATTTVEGAGGLGVNFPSGGNGPSGGASTGGLATTSESGGAESSCSPGLVDCPDDDGLSSGGYTNTGGISASGGETSSGGATSGGTSGSGGVNAQDLPAVSVYIAGDSTVSTYADTSSPNDQAGWGQMLHEIFDDRVTVVNKAVGGRTALRFYLEGSVQWILDRIQPEDYFFIQFGTNDSNKTATFDFNGMTYSYYAAADTDFKTYLKDYYIDPARAASAIPVLVTAPPRNSAYCGKGNSLGGYAQAMRELAVVEDVLLLDLNQKTFDYLTAICPSPTPEDFFLIKADSTVDGTHFQENGARHMAGFLGEELTENALTLAGYLAPQ